MITEFNSWHRGDIPGRDGWIVEAWEGGEYLQNLYHCDTWDEAVYKVAAIMDRGERGAYEARVYFRKEWRK